MYYGIAFKSFVNVCMWHSCLVIYKWPWYFLFCSGVPDFVEKMHVAAQQLQSRHQHLWQGDDDGEKQMVF